MQRLPPVLLPLSAALAALLALTWCTASQPATYQRGTLTRPPPAETRPGVGLPRYEPLERPLPPQPQPKPERNLPHTPKTRSEDTIWAASTPPAGLTSILLGIQLPFPDDADSAVDRAPTITCATLMHEALVATGAEPRLREHPRAKRECIAAALYALCARAIMDRIYVDKQAGTNYDLLRERGFKKALGTAYEYMQAKCPKSPAPLPEHEAINEAISHAFATGRLG